MPAKSKRYKALIIYLQFMALVLVWAGIGVFHNGTSALDLLGFTTLSITAFCQIKAYQILLSKGDLS